MTDEELTELTEKIFLSEVENLKLPNVQIIKLKGDKFYYMQTINKKGGKGVFLYRPNPNYFNHFLKFEDLKGQVSDEFRKEFGKEFVQGIFHIGLKSLYLDLGIALENLTQVPETIHLNMLETNTKLDDLVTNIIDAGKENAYEKLKSLFDKQLKVRLKTLSTDIAFFEEFPKPIEPLYDYFYSQCHCQWKEAKKFYKQNKNKKNWQEITELAYKHLPPDLIAKMSDSDTYSSTPSTIAHAHSARFLGIDDNSIGKEGLGKYLTKSRRWKEKYGAEAQEKELRDYLQVIVEKVQGIIYRAEFQGLELNMNLYPYILSIVADYLKKSEAENQPINHESLLNYIFPEINEN